LRLRDAAMAVSTVGSLYGAQPLELRVISPLAEGADRIVVSEALNAGYTLQAPLPFPRGIYEADFASKASVQEFRALLHRATAVLELDGNRNETDAAYASVGRVVLSQSDVLVAIWNGQAAAGLGGTEQVVRAARAIGIPVIWIRSVPPHGSVLLPIHSSDVGEGHSLDGLQAQIDFVLLPEHAPFGGPPSQNRDQSEEAIRSFYYRGLSPARRAHRIYEAFRTLFVRRRRALHEDKLESELTPSFPTPAATDYSRADLLAEHYGWRYRASFVGNYLLGALAVSSALAGFLVPLGTTLELLLVFSILIITWQGNRNFWHRRWINYRLLAEQLRHLELLLPVGRVPPSFRVPPFASSADPNQLWVNWFFRAKAREIGMATGCVDRDYLERYRAFLLDGITGQAEYHRRTAARNERLKHRLHRCANVLFWTALVTCVVHLAVDLAHLDAADGLAQLWRPESMGVASTVKGNAWLTALAAALPAFGAALGGILSQGEFDRIGRRSRAMSIGLDRLAARLARRDDEPAISSDLCAAVADEAAEAMTAELLDWQVTFRAKPLELPV
jgi:hypothetical protein